MVAAQYAWYVDWSDDGYGNPLALIPEEHVWEYRLEWGTTLDTSSSELGLITTGTGGLTLFEEGGAYVIPGSLTQEELDNPHRWALYSDGILIRQGRAIPNLGPNFGSDVQPTSWTLEGPWGSQLAELIEFEAPAGTLADALTALVAATGITMSASATLSDRRLTAISWQGSLAGLINAIASMGPAWPIETASGHILLLDVAHGSTTTGVLDIDEAWGIGIANSGFGPHHGLVRTRMTIPGVGAAEDELVVFGDEERWGRRTLWLPPWLENTAIGRASAFNAALNRSAPQTFVRLALTDDQVGAGASSRLRALAAWAVPGSTLRPVLPSPAGARTTRFTVLRTTLAGGFGRPRDRVLEGLAPGQPGLVKQVTLDKPLVTVADDQLSASVILSSTPDGTDRWWRFRRWNGVSWDPYSAATQYSADAVNETVTLSPLQADTFYEVEFTFDAGFALDCSISTVFLTKLNPLLLSEPTLDLAGQWVLAHVANPTERTGIASSARWVPFPLPNNVVFAICTAIPDKFGFVINTSTDPWSLELRLPRPLPDFLGDGYLLEVRPGSGRRISGSLHIQTSTFEQFVDIDTTDWRIVTGNDEFVSAASDFGPTLDFDQQVVFNRVARDGANMVVTSTLVFE